MMKPTQPQLKNQKKQTKSMQAAVPGRLMSAQEPIQLDSKQEAMVSLIQEYLLRYNLVSTLDVFLQEMLYQSPDNNNCQTELLTSFGEGNQEAFFRAWNKYLPLNIRMRDEQAKNLEFYLQIYFLIFDINPQASRKMNGQMQKQTVALFKGYLDTKGQELSKTNEFLQFYALPYVQKPQEHLSYKHLFTAKWLQELTNKLTNFLQELTSKEHQTVLEQMYLQYTSEEQQQQQLSPPHMVNMSQSNNQNYTIQLEMNNQELLGVIQDFNIKYNQMQQKFKEFIDHSKVSILEAQQSRHKEGKEIVTLSYELLRMVQSAQKGIPNQELESIKKRIEKHERMLSMSEQEVIVKSRALIQQANIFEQELSISPIPSSNKNDQFNFDAPLLQLQQQQQQQILVQLDYMKLHHLFISQTYPDSLCRVLQALRWRITKAKSAVQRREVLIQYAQYDIIGCNPRNTILMQKLLVECTDQVKEFCLRLVNAMASDYYGRSYLMDSRHLVKTLIDILKIEVLLLCIIIQKGDTLIRRNSLGALQKLSLRRKPQITMIDNELIRWIIGALKHERDTLSEYSYEYITALFMNLSMRQKGKSRCEDPKEGVLHVLKDLLDHENIQVQTFVNGTLYSLFSKQTLRDQARSMGMIDVLQLSMKNSDERFTKQIEYIIIQLNTNKPDDMQMDVYTNITHIQDDNDVDDIDDIDDNEEVDEEEAEDNQEAQDGINGEELLKNYFALNPLDSEMQINLTKSIMMENRGKRETQIKQQEYNNAMFRPATPTMTISHLSKQLTPKSTLPPPDIRFKQQNKNSLFEDQKMSDQLQYGVPQNLYAYPQEQLTEEEHKQAFESRAKIVRSPPQKKVSHEYLKRK